MLDTCVVWVDNAEVARVKAALLDVVRFGLRVELESTGFIVLLEEWHVAVELIDRELER